MSKLLTICLLSIWPIFKNPFKQDYRVIEVKSNSDLLVKKWENAIFQLHGNKGTVIINDEIIECKIISVCDQFNNTSYYVKIGKKTQFSWIRKKKQYYLRYKRKADYLSLRLEEIEH